MSRRTRLLELLTAADLARGDLAKEGVRAQRDAQNNAQWIGALSSLVPLAGGVIDKGTQVANENAMLAASDAVTSGASARGSGVTQARVSPTKGPSFVATYDQTPEQVAAGLVAKNKDLAAPEKTGNFFSDLIADPLGINSRAHAKASAAARQQLTAQVQANRGTDEAKARQQLATDYGVMQHNQALASAAASRKQAAELARQKFALDEDAKSADFNQKGFDAEERARHNKAMEHIARSKGGKAGGSSAAEKAAAAADKARLAEAQRLTSLRNSLVGQQGRLISALSGTNGALLSEDEKTVARDRIKSLDSQLDNVDGQLSQLWSVPVVQPEAPAAPKATAPAKEAPAASGKGIFSSIADKLFGDDKPEPLSFADAASKYSAIPDSQQKAAVDDAIDKLVNDGVPAQDAMVQVMSNLGELPVFDSRFSRPME